MTLGSSLGTRAPDLGSICRPCQPFDAFPSCRDNPLMSLKIDNRDNSLVFTIDWVVQECDLIPFGRNSRVADPAGSFTSNMAERKFKTLFAVYVAGGG